MTPPGQGLLIDVAHMLANYTVLTHKSCRSIQVVISKVQSWAARGELPTLVLALYTEMALTSSVPMCVLSVVAKSHLVWHICAL